MLNNLLHKIHWTSLMEGTGLIILQLFFALIAFLLIKKIGDLSIHRTFERMKIKKPQTPGRIHTLERLTLSIFSYTIGFILIVTIFSIFHLNVSALIAGAGVVGLAIGFGAQGLVSDVVTGFFILLERQMDVGDVVTLSNYNGVVEEVGLKTTKVRDFDGTLHYIPNRQIASLSNHSKGNMRALVDISVPYEENVDYAISILQTICDKIKNENENIVEGPDVLGVQLLGQSEVTIRVIAQAVNGQQYGVERDIKKAINEAFYSNQLQMPYPRQVHINKSEHHKG